MAMNPPVNGNKSLLSDVKADCFDPTCSSISSIDEEQGCGANAQTAPQLKPLSLAGLKNALFGIAPGTTFGDLPRLAQIWVSARTVLFLCLLALPFIVYRDQPGKPAKSWYVPFMGILACAIPSSGAPVAGGIVFLPLLVMKRICAQDAVAFAAACQALGIGLFAPMNWYIKDRSVFLPRALLLATPPGILGMLVAMFVLPIENDKLILNISATFSAYLVISTAHQLWKGKLNMGTSFVDVPLGVKDAVIFVPACFLGGMLTGYIGIGIEKVLFCILTSSHYGRNVRSSCCTSIVVVGWLSVVAFAIRAAGPRDPSEEGYIGAVPYAEWLMTLPGVLCGSLFGPWLTSAVGPRKIMIIFCILLTMTSTKEFSVSLGLLPEAECIPQIP